MTNTMHKCRLKMDSTPLITLFCLSVGRIRFPYELFIKIIQLHPPSLSLWEAVAKDIPKAITVKEVNCHASNESVRGTQ